jgi:hypothetical protein
LLQFWRKRQLQARLAKLDANMLLEAYGTRLTMRRAPALGKRGRGWTIPTFRETIGAASDE